MLHRKGAIVGLALLAVIAAALSAKAGGAEPAILAIRDATLFDAVNGVMLPHRTIVIAGGRIQAIGSPQQQVKIPAGARVLEARGKYVIPGLIEAHAHMAIVWDYAHITSDESMPLFLAHGVTSLRSVADDIIAEKLLAHYAEAHPELSPRVFLCSPLIEGDTPFHPNPGWNAVITDPAKVPPFVKSMADWGVTTLKIYVGTKRAVGREVIKEGHRAGLIVTGHLGNYSAQDAVADGIDSLEHIWSVFNFIFPDNGPPMPGPEERAKMTPDELKDLDFRIQEWRSSIDLGNPKARELVSALAEHKVMVDPTLVVMRNMCVTPDMPGVVEKPDNAFVPESLKKWWPTYTTPVRPETLELRKKEFRKYQDLVGILFRAGVPLLVGTDEPEPYVPPGSSLHQELELLVESGLTPAAALQAATMNNARALKKADELGSIEVGKWADMVILNANPLTDIRNTRKIQTVVRGGIVVADPRTLVRMVTGQ